MGDGGIAPMPTTSKEHTGRRPRTVYTITDEGLSALREWLASPLAPFAMEFEVMLRLFVAPVGTREQLIASLEQVKADARGAECSPSVARLSRMFPTAMTQEMRLCFWLKKRQCWSHGVM